MWDNNINILVYFKKKEPHIKLFIVLEFILVFLRIKEVMWKFTDYCSTYCAHSSHEIQLFFYLPFQILVIIFQMFFQPSQKNIGLVNLFCFSWAKLVKSVWHGTPPLKQTIWLCVAACLHGLKFNKILVTCRKPIFIWPCKKDYHLRQIL